MQGIKCHTGYYGCKRCSQKGEYHNNHVIFPQFHSSLITDAQFHEFIDGHHSGKSSLHETGICLVNQFLSDYMHLACLSIPQWKATEFGQFLLYIVPEVLKNRLPLVIQKFHDLLCLNKTFKK